MLTQHTAFPLSLSLEIPQKTPVSHGAPSQLLYLPLMDFLYGVRR